MAFLIAFAAAFVLGGYEFLRTPTNTLYVADYGKENLPMVMAFIPLSVALMTYGYGRVLSWLGPRRTLFATTLGSAVFIGVGQWTYELGLKPVIVLLYLFRSAYVVLIIEQYWSYINSMLTQKDAKKFNGPICGLASLGSIAAGVIGAAVTHGLGTSKTAMLSAVATLPAAFIADQAFRRCGEPQDHSKSTNVGGHLALKLFRSEKRLPLLLMIVILTQVVAAVMMLAFQGELQIAFPNVDAQTEYSYAFYAWINGIAAVLQFVAAPILMHLVNPGLINLLIPVIHMIACAAFLKDPTLATVTVAYAGFKCLDYSIFRAAKEVLYVPLTFEARYRTKEVIDVFGYRFSKGITSGVITLVQTAGIVVGEVGFGIVAMVSAVAWAALTLPLTKYYRMGRSAGAAPGGAAVVDSPPR